MDNRSVVSLIPSDKYEAYWYCPECNMKNEETAIVDVSDLTCQGCGANYKNGGPADAKSNSDIATEGLITSQIRCIKKYTADFLQESPNCPSYELGNCTHKDAIIFRCEWNECPLQ